MDHKTRIILEKIIDESKYIAQAIADFNVDQFVEDETLKRAVTMSLINIGELTSVIPEEFRKEKSYIAWSRIRRTRDKVAHHYIDIDHRIIWETVTKSVPELKTQIEELISHD